MLKYDDPAAICHGNPGGWQFSYRYATILLPWMFLLLPVNGPVKLSLIEVSLFAASGCELPPGCHHESARPWPRHPESRSR